jgi:HK97 family phage portal protein
VILNRAIRNAAAMMRAAEWGDSSIPPNSSTSPFGPSMPGAHGDGALAISTVLACVKALSDDVQTLPFIAYQGQRLGGARTVLRTQPRVILEPFGPDLEPAAGIGQLVVSKAMRGNAYMWVVSEDPRTGLPDQLAVIHPDTVTPVRRNGVKMFRIGGDYFGPDRVKHIAGMMLPGDVKGVDIVTAQRVNLDLARDVGEYAAGFFGNGGSPVGVISVPGQGDRKRAREVRDTWEASHAGVANAHRPAVMFGGATWEPMTVTPENAQFLETRRFLREEICGWFSVPLMRIQAIVDNASQGGGKGLDAIDAGYVKHGLLPMVSNIETMFSRFLPGDESTWAGFFFDEFLRASAQIRAQVATSHRVGAVRTIDEIRADEGWAPLPNGQGTDPFAPLNSNTTTPAGGADNSPAGGL